MDKTNREIGGYIELDTYRLPMLHEGAVALNCGRNALAYLLRARQIKKLWIPTFICDSVTGVCKREGVPFELYAVGFDFRPAQEFSLGDGEWLYLVNFYSQLDNETIASYAEKYKRVIVDNAQSYFQAPVPNADTLYTCRKYFGVADGAFLYTDARLQEDLPTDESFERMRFLLGRYERTASEFYGEYAKNNERFAAEPIKTMSKLTRNLLHAVDYAFVKETREQNFARFHALLKDKNELDLPVTGTFMYPLLIKNGALLRKKLQEKKIYIPTLWPAVFTWSDESDAAYRMARDILPLPVDQRYGFDSIETIMEALFDD